VNPGSEHNHTVIVPKLYHRELELSTKIFNGLHFIVLVKLILKKNKYLVYEYNIDRNTC